MDKSVKQSRIKASKIVMVIAAVFMLAFIIAAVVLGVNIPRTTRLYPSDGGTISSFTDTDGEEWFVSTRSNVILFRLERTKPCLWTLGRVTLCEAI